jgi:hypothetical protein
LFGREFAAQIAMVNEEGIGARRFRHGQTEAPDQAGSD